MKSLKVYLQYPWKFPDSPYYKYLVENPPEAVKYLNAENQKGVITNRKIFGFSNLLKRFIRETLNFSRISFPNSHPISKGDYHLVHCAHCLSSERRKPWVADIESIWQLYIGEGNKFSKRKVKKILLRDNCKKIMPWTDATARRIIREFPEIRGKVEVVYPAIPLPKTDKRISKEVNLGFVGRYFYPKGGIHALEAIDRMTKKHRNVKGIIVSDVPGEIRGKYSDNKKISFLPLMPQKKLFAEVFPILDILVYPGYSDSFGFIFLEAMSFGIPTVTVNSKTVSVEGSTENRKEIIEDHKTGLVSNCINNRNYYTLDDNAQKTINLLTKDLDKLIINKNLRKKFSKNCIKEIRNGKFSIAQRNKKLKEIYEGAIK